MATAAPVPKKAAKITSKADVMHMDGMRTGGHAEETHRGLYSSIDSVAAEVVAAGAALHVPVDAATARLVVAANTHQRLNELLDINANKYDFKYVHVYRCVTSNENRQVAVSGPLPSCEINSTSRA